MSAPIQSFTPSDEAEILKGFDALLGNDDQTHYATKALRHEVAPDNKPIKGEVR